jgi:hypothetical protein
VALWLTHDINEYKRAILPEHIFLDPESRRCHEQGDCPAEQDHDLDVPSMIVRCGRREAVVTRTFGGSSIVQHAVRLVMSAVCKTTVRSLRELHRRNEGPKYRWMFLKIDNLDNLGRWDHLDSRQPHGRSTLFG